jgi:hypothetical protein
MAATVWNPSSAFFAASSILVAGTTWIFWTRGFLDIRKPGGIIAAGAVTGTLNAVLTVTVTALLALPPYEGTQVVFSFFASVTGSPALASAVGVVVLEVIDKTLCLALAAVAALFLHGMLRRTTPGQ